MTDCVDCPACNGDGTFYDWDEDDEYCHPCMFCDATGNVTLPRAQEWINDHKKDEP